MFENCPNLHWVSVGQGVWKIKKSFISSFFDLWIRIGTLFYLPVIMEVYEQLFQLFRLKTFIFHFSNDESSSSSSSENDSVSSLMNCRSSSSKRTRSKKGESSEGIVFQMDDSMMQFGDAYDSEVILSVGILQICVLGMWFNSLS